MNASTLTARAEVHARIREYLQQLDQASVDFYAEHYSSLTPSEHEVEFGRRYARIVQTHGQGSRHVHAFVDLSNGDVLKPGGWSGPQRGRNGQLAARFNLLDELSRSACFASIDPHGSYLYV